MLKNYSVGIIGTGFGAQGYIPVFRVYPYTDVIAICGTNIRKTKDIAARNNIPIASDNYNELLENKDIDIICIVTPNYLHAEIAIAALNAGKHVLCEKPMATDINEAKKIYTATKDCADIIFGINFIWRFTPQRWTIKSLIEKGYLGKLYSVNVSAYADFLLNPPKWNWLSEKKAGGGTIYAWGSHAIDSLIWWFGDIESVYCIKDTYLPERKDKTDIKLADTEDFFSFVGKFRNSGVVTGQFNMISDSTNPNFFFDIRGSLGTIILQCDNKLMISGKDGIYKEAALLYPSALPEDMNIFEKERLLPQFLNLVHSYVSAIDKKMEFSPDCLQGLKVQSVLEALHISSQKNEAVRPDLLLGE